MVLLYIGLVYYLYRINRSPLDVGRMAIVKDKKIIKEIIIALIGIIAVMIISHWVIQITLIFLEKLLVSKLVIGLLIFSIGTNLPEIIITFTSWRRKSADLSLSHLMSSAFTNILVLGVLAILSPITFIIGPVYYALCFFVILIISLFFIFYISKRNLSRIEGGFLMLVYLAFLLSNFYLISR